MLPAGLWFVLGAAFVLYTAQSERAALERELGQESDILYRLVSQRAGQHDAHLTALSAIAQADDRPQADLFFQLAAAIRQFYPRIAAIDLVPLAGGEATLTTRTGGGASAEVESAVRDAASGSSGEPVLVPSPASPQRYLMVKRVPNSDRARFGLALEIDAPELVHTDAPFWRRPNAAISLALPDGRRLVGPPAGPSARAGDYVAPIVSEKPLGSRTQPLLLATRLDPAFADVFPAGRIAAGLATLAAIVAAGALAVRLVARTRSAELRARLGEQAARLAHASRINALGEMASGMAHELTQPLTAILSQSQAGVRLLARGDVEQKAIGDILKANVAQSKRAADILARLRSWSKPAAPGAGRERLNACMENVVFLLHPEAKRLGIELSVEPDPADPEVVGDAVEIEQVIFNFVRNAMEALERSPRPGPRIRVCSTAGAREASVEVADNGPGIAPEMRGRLFEPFATGKEGGMGLGLALCERLVERMGGRIEVADGTGGGATARVVFPLADDEGGTR